MKRHIPLEDGFTMWFLGLILALFWVVVVSFHLFVEYHPRREKVNRYSSDLYTLLQKTRSYALYDESTEEFAKHLSSLKGDSSASAFLDIMFDYAVLFKKGDKEHARLIARSSIFSRNLNIESFEKFKTYIENVQFAALAASSLHRDRLKNIIIRTDAPSFTVDLYVPPLWIYITIILLGAQFIFGAVYFSCYATSGRGKYGKWWECPWLAGFLLWFPGALPLVMLAGIISGSGAFLKRRRRKANELQAENPHSSPYRGLSPVDNDHVLLSKLEERLKG